MRTTVGRNALVLLALLASGCVVRIPARQGEARHVLVVGIGVVTTSDPANTSVVVTSAQSLGVVVSDRPGVKFGAGYVSNQVVSVAEGATDVQVTASRRFGGPLQVDTRHRPDASGSLESKKEEP